jgi:hypothetical protein
MSFHNTDFRDPSSVVQGFIHQMYFWESFAASLSKGGQARFRSDNGSTLHPEELRLDQLIRQIPPLIVGIYLTKRKRVYTPSSSYSIPPEYNPENEKVVRVVPKTKSLVIVETNRNSNYYGGIHEYVLKKQEGVWLIDSVSASLDGKKVKLVLL